MNKDMTGQQIVANMASGREWWQLRACDTQAWIDSLPAWVAEDATDGARLIGAAWDGVSDIALESIVVSGAAVSHLLHALREEVQARPGLGVAMPDRASFRSCVYASHRDALAIDFDFGDFVMPFALAPWMLEGDRAYSVPDTVAAIAKHLAHANEIRATILKREQNFRRALLETVEKAGHGAAPLWLRMEPLLISERLIYSSVQRYVCCMILLDERLEWMPAASGRERTMKGIRTNFVNFGEDQPKRARALAALRASGSEGWISEVALALAAQHGLEPLDALRKTVAASCERRNGSLDFNRGEHRESLYYIDGVLHASIAFDGGYYYKGWLTLSGNFPETLAIAAKGRSLDAFVDHPAFTAAAPKVARAKVHDRTLDISHKIEIIPVEAAPVAPGTAASALAA